MGEGDTLASIAEAEAIADMDRLMELNPNVTDPDEELDCKWLLLPCEGGCCDGECEATPKCIITFHDMP